MRGLGKVVRVLPLAVLDLDREHAIAEHLPQMRESFAGNGRVAGEAHRQHAQVVSLGDPRQVGIGEAERAFAFPADCERE